MAGKKLGVQSIVGHQTENGDGHVQLATAETAAPEQDLHPSEGHYTPTPLSLDELDNALGDETALRHEQLDTGPVPIEVRRPRKNEFFAVHPTYARIAELAEYGLEGKLQSSAYYLMSTDMKPLIMEENKKTVLLVLCQSMRGRQYFWWPLNLDRDGVENTWNRDSRKVSDEIKARQYYGRRCSVRSVKGYITKWAPDGHGSPEWPDKPRDVLLVEAFAAAGLYINSPQHPVFLEMEGAV